MLRLHSPQEHIQGVSKVRSDCKMYFVHLIHLIVEEFSLICCTSMVHAGNTKIWAKIISAYAKKCSITGFSSLRGGGGAKTQVYMPSRGMNA